MAAFCHSHVRVIDALKVVAIHTVAILSVTGCEARGPELLSFAIDLTMHKCEHPRNRRGW